MHTLIRDLKKLGVPFQWERPAELSGVGGLNGVILFPNYCPQNREVTNINIALPVPTEGSHIPPKCWVNKEKLSLINENEPNPLPDYKEFKFNGVTYFPFSIKTEGFSVSGDSYLKMATKVYNNASAEYNPHLPQIFDRPSAALKKSSINAIKSKKFCVLGCGSVGSLFAEMLVRTGCADLALIDDDIVADTNIGTSFPFFKQDVGIKKTSVLENHLRRIAGEDYAIDITCHQGKFGEENPDEASRKKIESIVTISDYVVVAIDKICTRREVEKLCRNLSKNFLSIGIEYLEKGSYSYECTWNPNTGEEFSNKQGYGQYGVCCSVVAMATGEGFELLLNHIGNPGSDSNYVKMTYKDHCIENIGTR